MTRTAPLLAGLLLLGGCAGEPTAAATTADRQPQAAASRTAAEHQDLAALRAATARFHRFEESQDAGYTLLFMNMCMADQSSDQRGGMGYHYVDVGLLDATVDVATPEALMYEPGPNGQLRLVGVEYVIPKAAWTSAEPPVLHGQAFTLNAFDLWALHVWAWKHNPGGMFDDWNARVTCEHATPTVAVAHH